jgi:hypothetical protein
MSVVYNLDGSVICTNDRGAFRTQTIAAPRNGAIQLAAIAAFHALDPAPDAPLAGTLDYISQNMPVPASTPPLSVADSSAVGSSTQMFARADHVHASKVRKERRLSISTATFTWTFPTPFGSGVTPICTAIAEDPANSASDSYNIQVVGAPTNTSVTFRVIRTSVVLGILGLNATPGTINAHCVALEP